MANDILKSISDLTELEEQASIEKELLLKKALNSDDGDVILKARQYLRQNAPKGVEQRPDTHLTSIQVDPTDISASLGFKEKHYSVSYDVLRAMGRTPIVKSIIETRKKQISNFLQPQANKYSPGYVIEPKQKYSLGSQKMKLTKAQEEKIEFIIEFLMNCGSVDNYWDDDDDFGVFISKLIEDSLLFDQGTFEIARDNSHLPCQFKATDSSTMRIADTFDSDGRNGGRNDYLFKQPYKGHPVKYVQIIDGNPVNEYYPWELCFGIRNPSTDIKRNGYGRGELEDMIQTVTALLNADYYNANFFKVGSAPKGILKYTGDINMNTVDQFKNQWVAQTAGVMNMHKIPLINADKMEFINLQQSNKDMEFAKYQEFLVKIACAQFTIDPSEIGFNLSGNSEGGGGLHGSDTKEKIQYSKNKGLKPLLKWIQRVINRYLITPLDKNFEFRFVGIDDETTFQEELDANIKMLTNFKTLNEIRREYNLKPIKGGDIVLNAIAYQGMMAQMQGSGAGQGEMNDVNPFDEMFGQDEEANPNPFAKQEDDDNPIAKSAYNDIKILLSKETKAA
jgi:hypothetical protein